MRHNEAQKQRQVEEARWDKSARELDRMRLEIFESSKSQRAALEAKCDALHTRAEEHDEAIAKLGHGAVGGAGGGGGGAGGNNRPAQVDSSQLSEHTRMLREHTAQLQQLQSKQSNTSCCLRLWRSRRKREARALRCKIKVLVPCVIDWSTLKGRTSNP